jgi:hypothetical protein
MTPKPARGLIGWVLRRTGFAGVALADGAGAHESATHQAASAGNQRFSTNRKRGGIVRRNLTGQADRGFFGITWIRIKSQ